MTQYSDHFPLILAWLPTLRIWSGALEVSYYQDKNCLDAVAICVFDRVDDPRHGTYISLKSMLLRRKSTPESIVLCCSAREEQGFSGMTACFILSRALTTEVC